ncbi:MAG: hypothetical protein ACI9QD_000833 [Thermoproteota archaeon]|jgi:hypothetical protein
MNKVKKILFLLALVSFTLASAQVTSGRGTYQEVIQSLYKKCSQKKQTLYLTSDQKKNIEEMAKTDLISSLAIRYKMSCPAEKPFFIYVDSHIVRTMNETVLGVVKNGEVKKIKITSFFEPLEYKPSLKWIAQLTNKPLNDKLIINNGVHGLSGASLSALALTQFTRRILALDHVIK